MQSLVSANFANLLWVICLSSRMLAWNMFYSTSYPIFVETTTAVKIKRSRTVIWGLNNTNNNCTTKYKHARPVEEIPMSYGRCWVRNLPILWIYSTQRGFNSHIMNWNGHISIYHTYRLYCSWLIWLNSFGCYSTAISEWLPHSSQGNWGC